MDQRWGNVGVRTRGQVGGTASLAGAVPRTPHTGRALTDHPEDAFLGAADPRARADRGTVIISGMANLSCGLGHAAPAVLRYAARKTLRHRHCRLHRQQMVRSAAGAAQDCCEAGVWVRHLLLALVGQS
jgi:hypothetical protein